jgi:hypothetical protein
LCLAHYPLLWQIELSVLEALSLGPCLQLLAALYYRARPGIAHFFQAISKTFGGGDRRFEGSRESFISSEWSILRGVSGLARPITGGQEPSNLRSLRSSVESLYQIWLSKRDNAFDTRYEFLEIILGVEDKIGYIWIIFHLPAYG